MTTTSRFRQVLWLTLAAAVVAAGLATPASAGPGEEPRSTFIVVLEGGVDPRAAGQDLARRHGGELGFVYEHALRGFSVRVSEQGAQGMARDRRVSYVERDQVVTTAEHSVPTGVRRAFADTNVNLAINGEDDKRVDVDIAIIDTGIASHPDLNTVAWTNCSGGSPSKSSCADGSAPDGNGHGTHVAGSAAALDNDIGVVGIAPGARLHAVKVLSDNGNGYMSWIVAGIDWVTARHADIEVANMSLGCECTSAAMNDAIAKSVDKGVTYTVAAGNSNKDASTFSPANHPDVITVSALADFDGAPDGKGASTCRADEDDTLANFSNYGSLVEIAAPGVCIRSTWPGGYNTISGTSMASPHVAGAAALLASTRSTVSPGDTEVIKDLLVQHGNLNWVDKLGDPHEPLLDVSNTTVFAPKMLTTSSGSPNEAPTASYTYTCTDTDLTCDFDGTGSKDKESSTISYAWDFGVIDVTTDTSTEAQPSYTYAAAGTYTVILTVKDGDGATGSTSQSVTVGTSSAPQPEPEPALGLALTKGAKVKGATPVTSSWTDSDDTYSGSYTVFVNGTTHKTVSGTSETTSWKGSGTLTYHVCRSGTEICSEKKAVTI